jgi:hypothetical protein
MYGILSYRKLSEGMLRAANKYNNTNPQGQHGKNRGANTAKLLQLNTPLSNDKTLILLLSLSQSTSKKFTQYIADELILGRYQFYLNTIRQNEQAVSLYSVVFNLSLLIASTKNTNNFNVELINADIPIAILDKTKALKFITQAIINQYFSAIQHSLNETLIEINQKIIQPNTVTDEIIMKNINDHYELKTENDSQSHIQLTPL